MPRTVAKGRGKEIHPANFMSQTCSCQFGLETPSKMEFNYFFFLVRSIFLFMFFFTFSFAQTEHHLRCVQGTNFQLLQSSFKSYNFVTLPFLSYFIKSNSRSTFVVLVAKALDAKTLVMYLFKVRVLAPCFLCSSL